MDWLKESRLEAIEDGMEWFCPECTAAGMYSDLNRDGGVDCCPECRSPVENIEG